MTNLDMLIAKINYYVDQKIKEVEVIEQNTNEVRENYIKQIKGMSKRIKDMLTLVNTLCARKIPKSEYSLQLFHDFMEEIRGNNCPISFAKNASKTYTAPPYYNVVLDSKKDETARYKLHVSTNEVRCYVLWSSGDMSEYPLTKLEPNKLYKFIVEFERAEQILRQFIVNL